MAEKKIEHYQKYVTELLLDLGKYHEAIEPLIKALASSLMAEEMAQSQLNKLKSTTIKRTTKYGEEEVAHPVFDVLKLAHKDIQSLSKDLGLEIWSLQTRGRDEKNTPPRKPSETTSTVLPKAKK